MRKAAVREHFLGEVVCWRRTRLLSGTVEWRLACWLLWGCWPQMDTEIQVGPTGKKLLPLKVL
ncbi:hypothetical protein [Streptomyces sedi]|uniref:hypothetical protein n=1 Tax=Streptomyces sedi TaxID=555059 RepID=UPI0031E8D568